jgi:hypothetical protein
MSLLTAWSAIVCINRVWALVVELAGVVDYILCADACGPSGGLK